MAGERPIAQKLRTLVTKGTKKRAKPASKWSPDAESAQTLPIIRDEGESELSQTERLVNRLIELAVENRQLTAAMAGATVLARIRGLDVQKVQHEVQIDTRQALRHLLEAGWVMPRTIPGLPPVDAVGVDTTERLLPESNATPEPEQEHSTDDRPSSDNPGPEDSLCTSCATPGATGSDDD